MSKLTYDVCGVALLVAFVLAASVPVESIRCEYYNETMCNSAGLACNETEECKPGDNDKGSLCYVLWQNSSFGFSIKLKGCWVGSQQDCLDRPCMETRSKPKMQLYFCCCDGDMCNKEIHTPPHNLPAAPLSDIPPTVSVTTPHPEGQKWLPVMYTLLSLILLTLVVVLGYYLLRRQRQAAFNELPTCEPSPLAPPCPHSLRLHPVQLMEVKAQGRFGAVWKAQMLNDFVAVKVFPPQHRTSWQDELEVYKLPQMHHPNLLYFYGAEKRGENLQAEYWLITAYHHKGSLCDYLKSSLVTWTEVISIADSIAKGLMHLHDEIPSRNGEAYKPAIAHRDFKSKNVLLKSDMTACVADFGLALVFRQGQSPGDDHGQVGTGRYMAPEVLEGAINFNRDAFLRIDMYACGLVLWELVSRCSNQEGPVDEYRLPFDEEVGQHPTLEDMQDVVVQKKLRPKFKDSWKNHSGLQSLCDTIEECWDHDAEARLSSSCVQERMSLLQRITLHNSSSQMTLVSGDQQTPRVKVQDVPSPSLPDS